MNRLLPIAAFCLSLLLAGCVKSDLASTSHPQGAQLTFAFDWSATSASHPSTLLMRVNAATTSVPATGTTLDSIYPAGEYYINFYNNPGAVAGIHLSGATVTLDDDGTSTNRVVANPGWFFTGIVDTVLRNDADYHFNVRMTQQMRQLDFRLTDIGSSTADIASIKGTLSGVAQGLNINTSRPTGNAATIAVTLTASQNDTFTGSVRLLDVMGSEQLLKLTVTYKTGFASQVLTEDLSSRMVDFGNTKGTPLTLSATMQSPSIPGASTSITPWEVVDGTGVAQ